MFRRKERSIEPPLDIRYSRWKLLPLVAGSLLVFFGGILILVDDPRTETNFLLRIPEVHYAVALLGIAAGGLAVYFYGRKLFGHRVALIINEAGVADQMTIFHAGFIPWQDIIHVEERMVENTFRKYYSVTLTISDPDRYIAAQKNGVLRKLLQRNKKGFTMKLNFSPQALAIREHELFLIMSKAFDLYKPLQPVKERYDRFVV